MWISETIHSFEKYLDLIKLHKLGENTGIWKRYANVKKSRIWKKYVNFRIVCWSEKSMFIFEKNMWPWKNYAELKSVRGFQKVHGYKKITGIWVSTGQNRGESTPKPVKTESGDEPYPVSVVRGASCPVLKLRDQI